MNTRNLLGAISLCSAIAVLLLAAYFQAEQPTALEPARVASNALPVVAAITQAVPALEAASPAPATPAPKPVAPVAAAPARPGRATQTAARAVDPPVVTHPIPPPAPTSPLQPPATQQQLDALLAPIALYPDQLLSQILMAATYPLEIIEAARWASRPENEGLQGDHRARALDQEDWDPSVKALAAFPHVLKMLDSELGWLAKLGEAFLAQETEVMDSVQRLRQEAKASDQLNSDARRRVTVANNQIIVEPANPEVVYVPIYDPRTSYGVWPYSAYLPMYFPPPLGYGHTSGIYYSFVSISPFWGWSSWDWPNRRIRIIDVPRYTHHNRGRGPIDNTVWKHDPDHRRGVHRGDRFDRAIDMRKKPDPPQLVNLPQPGPNDRRPRGPDLTNPIDNSGRGIDQVQPIRPRYRGTQPGEPSAATLPGALPDLSPPLAAGVDFPDVTPSLPTTVALPEIPPQSTPQAVTTPNRDRFDNFRTRRQNPPENPGLNPGAEPQTDEDESRRRMQFDDQSINAPVLSNVPPTRRFRQGESLGEPPLTNVPPPPAPVPRPMAAEAPVFQPPMMHQAPQAIAPEPSVQQPNFRQPRGDMAQPAGGQDEEQRARGRSRGDRTADD